jgi:hypothetical protein
MVMKAQFLILFCFTVNYVLPAQQKDIAAYVTLDSVVVAAQKNGFDVEEFIRLVQRDRSFYAAFRCLRFTSFQAENKMTFFGKKGQQLAAYQSTTLQAMDGNCRTMKVLEEKTQGAFYDKKKEYRFYTAKLYDRVFFTHGRVCANASESEDSLGLKEDAHGLEKYYQELKRLIFLPGEKAEIPIIGGRTEIFSPKLRPYYDYQITVKRFGETGPECYVFEAKVKSEYQQHKENRTIIKYMETYFERKTLQVMGRKYELDYQGALFSFAVKMEISLVKQSGKYLPQSISYQGRWDVPFRKEERGTFTCQIRRQE